MKLMGEGVSRGPHKKLTINLTERLSCCPKNLLADTPLINPPLDLVDRRRAFLVDPPSGGGLATGGHKDCWLTPPH